MLRLRSRGFEGCTLSDAGYFSSPKRNFGGEQRRTTSGETKSWLAGAAVTIANNKFFA
jgi:hypothetical protein